MKMKGLQDATAWLALNKAEGDVQEKREEKGEKRENHRKLESLHISGSQTGGMVEKRVRPTESRRWDLC